MWMPGDRLERTTDQNAVDTPRTGCYSIKIDQTDISGIIFVVKLHLINDLNSLYCPIRIGYEATGSRLNTLNRIQSISNHGSPDHAT
jgi:hypothetical protein